MSVTRVEVATREPYEVLVGRGVLAEVAKSLPDDGHGVVLSDKNVLPLHGHRLQGLAGLSALSLEPGEGSKSLTVLERVLNFLVEAGLDRRSTLITLGGGVVGDLGGLAASLYMRGIGLVSCPTTLLAQVDAAVGGKTAVNLAGGKNLAGTFFQPRAVFADPETLATLGDDDFRSGLGEVVKTALVGDEELLLLLEERAGELLRRDPDLMAAVVVRCVRVKGELVARDEREAGERKKLNLGHTFAHAIEHAAGFGAVPHGEAVATGLGLALLTSARLGLLRDPDLPERVSRILERLGLGTTLDSLRARYDLALAPGELLVGMRHDKKGGVGEPALVLPERVGSLALDQRADRELLADILS